MSDRVILHSDLNNFYASVERVLNPDLAGKPIAVCGNPKLRHGIVLAKSDEAKKFGVKTGDVIWEAKEKCPDLIILNVRIDEYLKYSTKVRQIYERYTDEIEPFGIDECWLDVTHSGIFGDGKTIAERIRKEVKEETGLTVSIGVSFNKVFAKLGSDYKKPDAITVIDKTNYKDIVYPLQVEYLLFVGKKTKEFLHSIGIKKIGDLANCDDELLHARLGKNATTLLSYARGLDESPVKNLNELEESKSISNSMTYFEDVCGDDEVKRLIYIVAESVVSRLKESGLGNAKTVRLTIKDDNLKVYNWQKQIRPTTLCGEIATACFELYKRNYTPTKKVRMIGICVNNFEGKFEQMTIDNFSGNYEKKKKVEETIENIRRKHGFEKLQRAVVLKENEKIINIKDDRLEHNNKPADFIARTDEYFDE